MFSEASREPHTSPAPSAAACAAIGGMLFDEASALTDKLSAWRHDLHQMPELELETYATTSYIQRQLDNLGVSYKTLLKGACVLAAFGSGKDGAPCVLLRADMDGLPIEEKSGEPWASTNGNAHACGHDMHATSLLGAAALLKKHEEAINKSGATIKLLFQPGEESLTGAKAAIGAGVLENPHVNAAFAMHVNGRCPMGLMLYGKQALAGAYTFRIVLTGKGGHGSVPQKCVDPIPAGVSIYLALQELVSREIAAEDEAVLTVGKFSAGSAANVIPDQCELEGTLRSYNNELIQRLRVRITEIVEGVAKAQRVTAVIETLSEVPPTTVDEDFTESCLSYTGYALPDVRFRNIQHAMGCEDFAFICQEVPSAYFTVGAAAQDASEHYTMHSEKDQSSHTLYRQYRLQLLRDMYPKCSYLHLQPLQGLLKLGL